MPSHPRLPADRALALAASLHTLRGLSMSVECCGATVVMSLKMALASGERGSLADMVLRLTCKRCGGAPETVTLLDRPDGLALPYGPPRWRLVVLERGK